MQAQTIIILKRPSHALIGATIGIVFSLVFLYFDGFYFLSPYLVFYVDPGRLSLFSLDLLISALSGVVLTISAYAMRNLPKRGSSIKGVGLLGIVAALAAGACPCYYLVPLLAAAGGAGGALGALGIIFNAYELPIKLLSLAILVLASVGTERSLRTACEIPLPQTR